MNPINHALNEVRYAIPAQVLQYAFIKNRIRAPRVPVSLDSVIRERVIEKRVIPDCDITGGVHTTINLSTLSYTTHEGIYRVYQLPLSATGGRYITSAISIGTSNYMVSNGFTANESSLLNETAGLQNAAQGVGDLHTPEVRIIGENIIIIEDDVRRYNNDIHLYCVLSNDPEMSNLPVRSHGSFSQAVVLATKAFIYNECRISIGSGVLSGGAELSAMREVIDEYSDAEELYKEYMNTKWARKAVLSDKTARKKHIRLITPGW